MKKLLLIFLPLLFLSCDDNVERVVITKEEYIQLKTKNEPTPEYPKTIFFKDISNGFIIEGKSTEGKILLIDSCEYIFMERTGDGGPSLTHKGNCKFCNDRTLILHHEKF